MDILETSQNGWGGEKLKIGLKVGYDFFTLFLAVISILFAYLTTVEADKNEERARQERKIIDREIGDTQKKLVDANYKFDVANKKLDIVNAQNKQLSKDVKVVSKTRDAVIKGLLDGAEERNVLVSILIKNNRQVVSFLAAINMNQELSDSDTRITLAEIEYNVKEQNKILLTWEPGISYPPIGDLDFKADPSEVAAIVSKIIEDSSAIRVDPDDDRSPQVQEIGSSESGSNIAAPQNSSVVPSQVQDFRSATPSDFNIVE